jgi:hypothetical protein
MRQLLISGLIIVATAASATASDRYPSAKRYVNQTGEVVTIGQVANIMAYAPVRRAAVLPAVQTVPVLEQTIVRHAAPRHAAPQVVAVQPRTMLRGGLSGSINVDPANWPSGRTCCRPGQPYFNENPDS